MENLSQTGLLIDQWQTRNNVNNTCLAYQLKCSRSLVTLLKQGVRNWTPERAEAMEYISGGEIHRFDLLYPHDSQPLKTQSILNRLIKKYNDFIRR